MNKQRWILLALLGSLAIAWQAGLGFAQEAGPPSDAASDQPPVLVPGLEGEAGKAKPFTIAEQLGLGAGNEDAGSVETTAAFTIQEGARRGVLSLTASITPEWHIYSLTQQKGGTMPSKINVINSDDFKILGPFQPDQAPHVKHDKLYRVPLEEHEGMVTWTAPIELAEGVKPESLKIPLSLSGQICKTACMVYKADAVAEFDGFTPAPATPGEYRPDPREAELTFRGHLEPAAVRPGGSAKLVITAEPSEGWHVYAYAPIDPKEIAKPTLIYLPQLPGWTQSAVKPSSAPKVEPAKDSAPEARYYDQPVTWTIDITVPADLEPGEQVLTGYLGFQTCKNQGGCLPPAAVGFRASLPVANEQRPGEIPLEFVSLRSNPTADQTRDEPAQATTVASIKSYSDVARLAAANYRGPEFTLGTIIGFSLLGGFILNLMPCVLPVIGLKVLSFVQQGGQSRAKIFALNLWFSLGLILVFLVLASAAVFAKLSWGEHFGILEFQVAMVVLVFAFALSFLGVWEVPIPGFAQSGTSTKLQRQEGPTGAFFKGIFTTLLATPCSGPFLGTVFGYALRQPPTVTYLIFACIGIGMASPYLLIGAFPALVKWLPKPGAWMETFKQLMGFFLLGTVVYLFSLVKEEYFIATLTLMMGVWFACWVIGRVPIYESTSKQLTAWVSGCATAALVGFLAFSYLGPHKELLQWEPFSPEALAQHQREGKTVMIDFTADWCPTCKVNLAVAINTPRVKELVEKNSIVPLLADWSDRGPIIKAKLNELNANAIPVMAIYPANKPGEVIVLKDLLLEGQVLAALEQAGPSKTAAAAAAGKTDTAMTP